MRKTWTSLALVLALHPFTCFAAKKVALPAAPTAVVARVQAARSVFISMGHEDSFGFGYRTLYLAVAAWPGVTIADRPAQSDIVLQAGYRPQSTGVLHFAVIDPATQQPLWEADVKVGWKTHFHTVQLNFEKGIPLLLPLIRPMSPMPVPVKTPVPVPPQMHMGSKVYLLPGSVDYLDDSETPTFDADAIFAEAVKASGLYTIVDSPAAADLILTTQIKVRSIGPRGEYPDDFPGWMELTALDPATRIPIWSHLTVFVAIFPVKPTDKRMELTMPYVLRDWKALITAAHL